jgi:hypothetical protein
MGGSARAVIGRSALTVGAVVLLLIPGAAAAFAGGATPAAGPACTIIGTPGPDTLSGTPGPDVICGLGGTDVISGGAGDDTLIGGPGDDTLEGEGDNDTLDGGTGVDTCVQGAGFGSISNCEALSEPAFSVSDAAVAEGNPGDANQLVFTVTLASPLGVTSTVDYATADGTALAPDDYTATSGTLSFPAGTTSETVSVPVSGDFTYEPAETMTLGLSNPAAGSLGDASGTGAITNDDPQYQLNITDVSGPETQATFIFKVTLTPPSTSAVYVQYQTIDQTASSPADYAGTIGVLQIPAGAGSKKLSIPIENDAIDEPTEAFGLTLTNATGATIIDGSAVGTILDNDSANSPSLTLTDASVAEGNSGSIALNFTATLNTQSGYLLHPSFTVVAGTALESYDYLANAVTASFAPGQTTAFVTVPIRGDKAPEHDETFTIKLTGGTHLVLNGATATGTILNDDAGVIIDFIGPGYGAIVDGAPAVSADGRYVAFISHFSNRGKTYWGMSARDRSTGNQIGFYQGNANVQLFNIEFSGDGSSVAFSNGPGAVTRFTLADQSKVDVSPATDASLDGDGNLLAYRVPAGGISLYQFDTASITPVSTGSGESEPVISADGNHVAYVEGDGTIHVFDVATTVTTIASVASDSTPANASSFGPTISADGRYVAFSSAATNLVAGDTNNSVDVFRHDMTTGTTIRVSVATGGSQLAAGGSGASMSYDGAVVVFTEGGGQLVTHAVGGSTTLVASSVSSFGVLSGDGHTVVFASRAKLVDGKVFRRHPPEVYAGIL